MKLEQIVTSRELSEKLAKYIKGDSLFWWNNTIGQKDESCWRVWENESKEDTAMISIPAYTATELAELMKDVDDSSIFSFLLKKRIYNPTKRDIFLGADPNNLGEILLWLCEHELINLK